MKKIKSSLALLAATAFLSVTLFSSCGGKKEEKAEETTEHPSEGGEHPTDGGEHPTEHPTEDTTSTN